MATLHIEIPDQKTAALKAYAQAQSLTVEKWLERLVEQAPLQVQSRRSSKMTV